MWLKHIKLACQLLSSLLTASLKANRSALGQRKTQIEALTIRCALNSTLTMKAFTHLKVSRNGAAQRFILPKQACDDQSLFKDSP